MWLTGLTPPPPPPSLPPPPSKLYDVYGNRQVYADNTQTVADSVSATLCSTTSAGLCVNSSAVPAVFWQALGVYNLTFNITSTNVTAVQYSLAITVNGVGINCTSAYGHQHGCSPITLWKLWPGPPSANASTVAGPYNASALQSYVSALATAPANGAFSPGSTPTPLGERFYLVALVDSSGNAWTVAATPPGGQSDLLASADSSVVVTEYGQLGDGKFCFGFSTNVSGNHSASLRLGSSSLLAAAYNVSVGALSYSASRVSGIPGSVTAGAPFNITVFGMDGYGNSVPFAGTELTGSFSSMFGVSSVSVRVGVAASAYRDVALSSVSARFDAGSGTYYVPLNATVAGTLSLAFTKCTNAGVCTAATSSITVSVSSPAAFVVLNTQLATTDGTYSFMLTAGGLFPLLVSVVDAYSNVITATETCTRITLSSGLFYFFSTSNNFAADLGSRAGVCKFRYLDTRGAQSGTTYTGTLYYMGASLTGDTFKVKIGAGATPGANAAALVGPATHNASIIAGSSIVIDIVRLSTTSTAFVPTYPLVSSTGVLGGSRGAVNYVMPGSNSSEGLPSLAITRNGAAYSASSTVTDNGDGTATVSSLSLTLQGSYVIQVLLNGIVVQAPSVVVYPAPADRSKTLLRVENAAPTDSTCSSGVVVSAYITDAYGNPVTGGGPNARTSIVAVLTAASPLSGTFVFSLPANGTSGFFAASPSTTYAASKIPGSYSVAVYASAGVSADGVTPMYDSAVPLAAAAVTYTYQPATAFVPGPTTFFVASALYQDYGVASFLAGQLVHITTTAYDACGYTPSFTALTASAPTVALYYNMSATVAANYSAGLALDAGLTVGSLQRFSYQPQVRVNISGTFFLRLTFANGYIVTLPDNLTDPSTPPSFKVAPGPIVAAKVNAAAVSILSVAADFVDNVMFTVTPADAFGNAFTASDALFDSALVGWGNSAGIVLPLADKGFVSSSGFNWVNGTVSLAGTYTLRVSFLGTPINNTNTLNVTVSPAATTSLKFVSASSLVFIAGAVQNVMVQGYDDFGNSATSTSDNVTLAYAVSAYTTFTSPSYAMASVGPGLYGYNVTVGLAGALQLVANLTSGIAAGFTVTNSSFSVSPGTVSPSNSYAIFGDGDNSTYGKYVCNSIVLVRMAALDANNNSAPTGVSSLAVSVASSSSSNGTLDAAGYFWAKNVTLGCGSIGSIAITAWILTASTSVQFAQTTVTVLPGAPDATKTNVTAGGPYTAGASASYQFTLFDSYGNLLKVYALDAGSAASVTTVLPDAAAAALQTVSGTLSFASSTGVFSLAFLSTQTGTATVTASFTINGGAYPVNLVALSAGAPAYRSILISPGVVNTSCSYAYGAGIEDAGAVAGLATAFYVQLTDMYSNPVLSQPSGATITAGFYSDAALSSVTAAFTTPTAPALTWDSSKRVYACAYTPTTITGSSNEFFIQVKYNAAVVPLVTGATKGDVTVQSSAGTLAASLSGIRSATSARFLGTTPTLAALVGQTVALTAHLVDSNSAAMAFSSLPSALQCTVTPAPASYALAAATDCTSALSITSGTIGVAFTATVAGSYQVAFYYGGTRIGAGSGDAYPLTVSVSSGPSSAAMALVTDRAGLALLASPLLLTAGAPGYLTVSSRDVYGNLKTFASIGDEDMCVGAGLGPLSSPPGVRPADLPQDACAPAAALPGSFRPPPHLCLF